MMKFTPQQVRNLIGVETQTLRYWKAKLAPIAHYVGYAPCYTIGDIVALHIVRVLVRDFNVGIGKIAKVANELFQECRRPLWENEGEVFLIFDPHEGTVRLAANQLAGTVTRPLLVIPLVPIFRALQQNLTSEFTPPEQRKLPTPSLIRRSS